jgi:hypothetical protein
LAPSGIEITVTEATQQKRQVIKIHQLDGGMAYNETQTGYLFDIAILEVELPFKFTQQIIPAKLPTVKTPVGKILIVSGWGATSEGKMKSLDHLVFTCVYFGYI